VPAWWHFDVRVTPAVEAEVAPAPARPKKRISVDQLQLPAVDLASTPPAPQTQAAPSAFATSSVLAALGRSAKERDLIVKAVEFLLERQGVATEAAFATALTEPAWRIGGVVAKLQEALNIDGYQVIRFDAGPKTIHLDREKLAQQFEVKL